MHHLYTCACNREYLQIYWHGRRWHSKRRFWLALDNAFPTIGLSGTTKNLLVWSTEAPFCSYMMDWDAKICWHIHRHQQHLWDGIFLSHLVKTNGHAKKCFTLPTLTLVLMPACYSKAVRRRPRWNCCAHTRNGWLSLCLYRSPTLSFKFSIQGEAMDFTTVTSHTVVDF